jgi:hypothetical protein
MAAVGFEAVGNTSIALRFSSMITSTLLMPVDVEVGVGVGVGVVVVGVGVGVGVGVAPAGWKVATTAYQSAEAPSVAVPPWGPAAPETMSSSNSDPDDELARPVKATPALLPGAADCGELPVISAEYTSSPAGTAAVGPVLTAVPTPDADTT